MAHAHLVDEAGALVAAGGLHGAEWVMVVAGRALDGIDSPGLLIAMLKHTAARCEAEGRGTTLRHTLDAWLALLEAERAERAEMKRAAAVGPGPQVH